MISTKNTSESMSGWQSIREKWTVSSAITILMVSFFVIIGILIYLIWQRDTTLLDKIITIFNAFLMAVLGYLFGYVPAKSSEESIKKDKESNEKEIVILKEAIEKQMRTIKDYENTVKELELAIALEEAE